jgi:hypothetical protein
MSKAISDAAAALGRKGGQSNSKRKIAAVRLNLEKARKNRWKQPRKKSA